MADLFLGLGLAAVAGLTGWELLKHWSDWRFWLRRLSLYAYGGGVVWLSWGVAAGPLNGVSLSVYVLGLVWLYHFLFHVLLDQLLSPGDGNPQLQQQVEHHAGQSPGHPEGVQNPPP